MIQGAGWVIEEDKQVADLSARLTMIKGCALSPAESKHVMECVEVGSADGAILVRDTKNRDGRSLHVSPGTWRRFAATIKTRALPR